MRTIFAEYNPKRNSIDVYTSVGYMLRIDCWEAEKDLYAPIKVSENDRLDIFGKVLGKSDASAITGHYR